jgi:helix-turn-helix protein
MSHDPLLTEAQAAVHLGNEIQPFSQRTLQRWRMEGYGPDWLKIGKSVRYRQSRLDEFLANCERDGTVGFGGAR